MAFNSLLVLKSNASISRYLIVGYLQGKSSCHFAANKIKVQDGSETCQRWQENLSLPWSHPRSGWLWLWQKVGRHSWSRSSSIVRSAQMLPLQKQKQKQNYLIDSLTYFSPKPLKVS